MNALSKRHGLPLFMAALLLAFVWGCDQTPQTPPQTAPQAAATKDKPLVGVLLYDGTDNYISIVGQSLQGLLQDSADYVSLAAENDQHIQDGQIDTLLDRGADVLVVNVVDTLAASFVVDKVQKAGIPVIFFNREPDVNSLSIYEKACFIGSVIQDAGKMQGDVIKRLWDAHPEYDRNGDGSLQYIMIQASADNPEAVARTEYSVRQARELGVPLQQTGDTLISEWRQDLAYQNMQVALSSLMDSVELVIANSDAMALGAVQALQEKGYNLEGGDAAKFIPVVGVDALPIAIEAISKGTMSATVKQDGVLMAETIAAFVRNALAGKEFLDGTGLQWDGSGIAVRLPYEPYAGETE